MLRYVLPFLSSSIIICLPLVVFDWTVSHREEIRNVLDIVFDFLLFIFPSMGDRSMNGMMKQSLLPNQEV